MSMRLCLLREFAFFYPASLPLLSTFHHCLFYRRPAPHVSAPNPSGQKERLADKTLFRDNSGSDAHALTVFNTNGAFLNTLYPYAPLLSTRATPIATTTFHPHRMLLATGCVGSNFVNVYGIGRGRGGEV